MIVDAGTLSRDTLTGYVANLRTDRATGFVWEEQGYCWSLFTFHPRMKGTVNQLRRAHFSRPQQQPGFLVAIKQ
jgi:hypothetical protein